MKRKISIPTVAAGLTMMAVLPFLAGCGRDPHVLTGEEAQKAELGARDIAERSGADYIGCSGQDSYPPDGYVTCSTRDRAAPHTLREYACAYGSRGCKGK